MKKVSFRGINPENCYEGLSEIAKRPAENEKNRPFVVKSLF